MEDYCSAFGVYSVYDVHPPTISENAVQSGKQIYIGAPKAHKQRTVPLPEFLLRYLARQCEGKRPRRPTVVR